MSTFIYLASYGCFVAFVLGAAIIIFFTFMSIWKGMPNSPRNKKGLPDYQNRKDTCNLNPELAHGHHEPHV